MEPNSEEEYKYVSNKIDWKDKLKIKRWCEVDMDSDGNKETLIELSSSNILLLHSRKNVVYGYAFPFRGMNSVKRDGSFQGSDSAGTRYVGKLKFTNNKCFYDEICIIDELDKNKPIYRINKKNSNRKAVKLYLNKQEKRKMFVGMFLKINNTFS